MNFHHEQQLDPLVDISLSLDESNLKPIAYQLQHQQVLSIFPVETSISQQVSPSISLHDDQAALEAQKRKRVSLAEYRQRKETIISSPSSSHTSLNNKCSSELLKNSDSSNDHQTNSSECSNTELDYSESNSCDLFIKKEEEKQSYFELDNISSGKSKINKLLTEIMANNKKQATNTLSFNCFESKAAFTSKTIRNVELSSNLSSIPKADFETASVAVNRKQQEPTLNDVACSKMDHEKSDISDPILLKPVSQITSNSIFAENIKEQPSSVQQQQLPIKQEKQDETEEGEYPSDEENENGDDETMNVLDIKAHDSASRNGVNYDDFEFDSRTDEKSSSYSNLFSKQASSSLIRSSKKDHQNKKYLNEYTTANTNTNNTTTATLTNDSILSSHRRRRSISVASSIGSVHSISFDSSSIKSSASERQHHLNRSSMRTIHHKHRHRHKTRRSQSIGNRSMHSGGCSISSRSVSATSVSEIMDLMIMENSSSKKKEEKHSVSNGTSNRKKYEEEDYKRQLSVKQQSFSRNSSLSNYYSNNNNNFNYSSSNNSHQNSSRKRSKSRSNNKHASSSSSSSIPVSSSRMARTQTDSYFRGKYENYKFSERNTSDEMRGHLSKKPRMSTSPTSGYDNTNVNESQSYSSSNSNHRNSSDLFSNLYSSSSTSLVDNNKNRRDYHTNSNGYINSNYSKDNKEEDLSGKYRRYFSTNSQSSLTITREYDLSERATLNELISGEATNDSDLEFKKNNKSIENSDGACETAELVEPLLSHELGNGILNVSASSSSAVSTSNTENNMDSLDGGNHQRDSYRVQTKTNRSSSSSKEYHRSRSSSRYQQSSSSNQRIPFSSMAYTVASSATGSKRRQSSLSRERDLVSSYNSGESFKSSLNHWSSSSKMYYNSSKQNTYHHYNNHHHNNHHHHHHHHQNRSIINEDYYNFQKRQSAASNSSYRIGSSSKQSDLSTHQRQNKSSDSYYRNKKESPSSSSSSSSNKYDLRYQLDKVHKKQNGSTELTSSTSSSSSSTSSLASSSSLLKIQSAVSLASATSFNENNKK